MTDATQPKRSLSGIQPSGQQHLGNYFGAIRAHVAQQDDGFYFIADYHALTTSSGAESLRTNVFDTAATYLACGLDPERAVLYRQSDVPEVTELSWLLASVTGMGLLERAHSYKDKKANGITPSVGLFYYPVLMAADILAVDAGVVPVGRDQVQHLEMTRDMATYFNEKYGPTFVLPETRLGTPETVPGVDGRKMSKSYGNTIPIFERGKALKKLVMGIKTDSTPMEDPKEPDGCTVFALYSLMASDDEKATLAAKYRAGNFGYGHAKLELLEKLNDTFGEMRDKREALEQRKDDVEDILRAGAKRARAVAREVLGRARANCGLD